MAKIKKRERKSRCLKQCKGPQRWTWKADVGPLVERQKRNNQYAEKYGSRNRNVGPGRLAKRPLVQLWNGKPRLPKQARERGEEQHRIGGTDNTERVVLEA